MPWSLKLQIIGSCAIWLAAYKFSKARVDALVERRQERMLRQLDRILDKEGMIRALQLDKDHTR